MRCATTAQLRILNAYRACNRLDTLSCACLRLATWHIELNIMLCCMREPCPPQVWLADIHAMDAEFRGVSRVSVQRRAVHCAASAGSAGGSFGGRAAGAAHAVPPAAHAGRLGVRQRR